LTEFLIVFPITELPSHFIITYESKLLFEFELTKPEADNTVKDVTQEAYFAHGLHRAKNGVGQSLTNSLFID